jgi:hydrogenase-4 transcriptional activator
MVQSLLVRPFTEEERRQLTAQMESANKEEARRAQLLLLSAERKTSAQIAVHLDFHPSNVKKWIRKFNEEGIPGIEVRKRGPREGPRPSFSRDQVEKLLVLASTDPSSLGLDFKKWTAQKLATAAADRGIVERISHVTVQQILKRNHGRLESGRQNLDTASRPAPSAAAPVPGGDRSNFALGKAALSQYQFSKAAELLYQALGHDMLGFEEEAETRSLLSQALEELGRDEEAYRAVEKYQDAKVVRSLPDKCRARVKLRLGWAHSWLRNHPSAIASLNEAKKLFLELQDQRGVCESLLALGRTYIVGLTESRIARDHLLEILKLQESADDPELMARTYTQLGIVDFYEGAFKSSNEHYLKALKLAEACTNPNVIGAAFINLGTSSGYDDPGERERAASYSRRAIEHLSEGGHIGYLVLAYNNLGDILRISGDWAEALTSLDKAIEIALRANLPNHEAAGRQTKAELLSAMGRYDEAEELVNRCIQLAEKDGDKWLESYAVRILGGVYLGRGQVDNALASLRQALRLSTSVGDHYGIAVAELALAEGHFQQGGYEQASEYVELAYGRIKEEKSKSLLLSGTLQRLHGQIQGAYQHFSEAKNHLTQSLSVFAATAIPFEVAKSHHAMGLLLRAVGDPKGAESHLIQAYHIFKSLGAIPSIEQTSQTLAEIRRIDPDSQPAVDLGQYSASAPGEEPPQQPGAGFRAGSRPGSEPARDDVALMQRLIEASASRDVLIRELASIVYERFSAEVVMVCRATESGEAEPVAIEGITVSEADRLCHSLERPPHGRDGIRERAYIAYIYYGKDAGRQSEAKPSLFLYASPSSQIVPERLYPLVRQAELGLETCSLRAASSAVATPALEARTRVVMPGFIVGSPLMLDVIDKIYKIRTSDVTVLITGESGTGKELVARAIHAESARARAIFLPFNCTATPRDLIDSQLFGHRRGAFTGAIGNYPGMVRAAEGGTLFLDEIGDLALEVQPKLMRFLQESEIQPLGETKPQRVDVRIIAATNSELERAVEEGRFREDLFHRLNIIRIHVPPLRDRREEVPVLASFFLEHFASRSGNDGLTLTQDAMDALTGYDWPGNVRQLRNEIERATAYTSGAQLISADDLSPEVRATRGKRRQDEGRRHDRSLEVPHNGNGRAARPTRPSHPEPDEEIQQASSLKLKDAIAVVESRLIRQALGRNKNNLSRTAIDLGLSRRGLRLKLAQLGIERE